ncbi:Histidinol dehydrogenase [Gloeothece citriformis PCC 7424]|uniref:Histidinol dehydrogenase n=1 Tax=Gloeothece citriformis (strain PCC 7424) TaxID=65393 RepID=B7KG01_GLOC7|nr:histidinol dehydrogenase [Gloeothece citriformis]ACK69194.1 Histidinol dehydrogenase [Gloeothece citriformis PCC 7424]
MLRIITQQTEAQTELKRIRDRTRDLEFRQAEEVVKEILEGVKRRGNQALVDYAEKFEGQSLNPQQVKVSGSDLDAAYQQISKELLVAIQQACLKIEHFHRQRLPKSWVQFDEDDVVLGRRYQAVERAGLYIPNGHSPLLSLVLLQAIPAKVAKVGQIVMVTPPDSQGKIHPAILVAAQEAGVTEIYRIGGASAIAALAYGTETIPKVDVITGLGNIYVTLAKKMVNDSVKIDALAEASELLIIADHQANAGEIAADLIAQAERTPLAASILLTSDPSIASQVQQQVTQRLQNHPQRILTEKAIAHYGLIVVVHSLDEAVQLSNFFAPQHLELAVSDPWELLEQIRHAGAIFLGTSTPMIIGDFLGGSAVSVGTAGAVRYASALGVEIFMKHSNLIQYSPVALKKMSNTLQVLAEAEGLFAGVESVKLRLENQNSDENNL